MDVALSAARLLLATVLAAAALGKALDRTGARRALLDLGAPPRTVPAASVGLPLAETAVAVALLVAPSARVAALAAAVLLAVFTIAMVRTLRAGRRPDCHCFGALHSERVGVAGIVRNVVLVAVAVFVAASSGQPAIPWPVAAAVPVLVGVLAALGARRSAASLDSLLAPTGPCVLAFVDAGCPPCRELMPDLARWQASLARDLPVRLVVSGDVAAYRTLATQHGLSDVVVHRNRDLMARFGIRGTPSAVLVDPDGTVAGEQATGALAIEALIRTALRRHPATGARATVSHAARNSRP